MGATVISAVIVSTTSIESLWPHVKHFIEKCDGEISTAKDLYPLLIEGKRFLCLAIDGVEVKGAGIYKAVHGFNNKIVMTTLGGDGVDWNDAITDFAKQMAALGFNRLEVQGRRGWVKSLKAFNEMHTTIGMDLDV